MNFCEAEQRLLEHLRLKVRSGQLTERGLARLAGVSQPHIHNVLSGKRRLSLETADLILQILRLDLRDFILPEEISEWRRE